MDFTGEEKKLEQCFSNRQLLRTRTRRRRRRAAPGTPHAATLANHET